MFSLDTINANLDKHFKSNNGNFMVTRFLNPEMSDWVSLSYDCRRTPNISPKWVALFILRTEKAVNVVSYGAWIFTRDTLGRTHKI